MPFDWENSGPCPEALAAFQSVQDETEFPDTYSGQAWRAAYRIWKVFKENPAELLKVGPYDDCAGVSVEGLGLSGFMWGWALNAVRQMFNYEPGGNGAIVTLGKGNEPYPSVGPAEQALKRVLG